MSEKRADHPSLQHSLNEGSQIDSNSMLMADGIRDFFYQHPGLREELTAAGAQEAIVSLSAAEKSYYGKCQEQFVNFDFNASA